MQLCQIHKRQFKAMAPLYLEGGSFVNLGIHIAQKFQRRTKEKNKTKDKGSQIHREEEKMRYVFFFFFSLSLSLWFKDLDNAFLIVGNIYTL